MGIGGGVSWEAQCAHNPLIITDDRNLLCITVCTSVMSGALPPIPLSVQFWSSTKFLWIVCWEKTVCWASQSVWLWQTLWLDHMGLLGTNGHHVPYFQNIRFVSDIFKHLIVESDTYSQDNLDLPDKFYIPGMPVENVFFFFWPLKTNSCQVPGVFFLLNMREGYNLQICVVSQ